MRESRVVVYNQDTCTYVRCISHSMPPTAVPPSPGASSLPAAWQDLFTRLNTVAACSDAKILLQDTLTLVCELCGAEYGVMYEYRPEVQEVVCRVRQGNLPDNIGVCLPVGGGLLAEQVTSPGVRFYPDLQAEPDWQSTPGFALYTEAKSMLVVPFTRNGELVAVGEIFDPQEMPLDQIAFVSARLSTEIHKAFLLMQGWRDNARLQALIAIIGELSSTLDRDRLLRLLINYAAELLNAEASSLFLVDEKTGELVLHLASNWQEVPVEKVRVPPGKGIIGETVSTGQPVLVSQAAMDGRHYPKVDLKSGFVTRSVLAVPLRTQELTLGKGMGRQEERIIGGLEALNKRQGDFTQQDARMLELLARQAATILSVADLYADANELFLDVIQALVASIDAKDPYTEGHSRRVSEFSVAIARELGMPPEFIHQVRIGSLLHDVGKIGVPDSILKKPERLTEEEFSRMKEHPAIGGAIMRQVRLLEHILPAIEEHHERLDGRGYPHGLTDEQISLLGRIVAVADVFDALTSDRPYREGWSAEEALSYLHDHMGEHFSPSCVQALTRAYVTGKIRTQKERDTLQRAEKEAPNPSQD